MKKRAVIPQPLIIEQTHHAPTEKVWDAITVEDQMRNCLHPWKIVEEVHGRKIRYEWRLDDHPGNSQLTFELFAEGDKTRLVLTQECIVTNK
jgi:uncharacterized protein YndB with AHSA1/START domain